MEAEGKNWRRGR